MNTFDQNSPIGIACLTAQRSLYNQAKRLRGIRAIIAGPFTIFFGLIGFVFVAPISQHISLSEQQVRILLGCVSVALIAINELVLARIAAKKTENAARIQEKFDCSVLKIDVNKTLGKLPSTEAIHHEASNARLPRKEADFLTGWYAELPDDIPAVIQTTIRQRANAAWDIDLRNNFRRFIGKLAPLAALSIIIYAAWADKSVRDLVPFVATLGPMLIVLIRSTAEHKDALYRTEFLLDKADKLVKDAMLGRWQDSNYRADQRQLQDQIFNSRRSNPLIPNWYYWLHRKRHESAMQFCADQIVHEWRSARAHNNLA